MRSLHTVRFYYGLGLTLGLIQSTIHVVVMFNVKGKMYILLRHAVAFLHAAYSTVPFFWICVHGPYCSSVFCVSLAGRCKIGGFQYGHSQLCEGQLKTQS